MTIPKTLLDMPAKERERLNEIFDGLTNNKDTVLKAATSAEDDEYTKQVQKKIDEAVALGFSDNYVLMGIKPGPHPGPKEAARTLYDLGTLVSPPRGVDCNDFAFAVYYKNVIDFFGLNDALIDANNSNIDDVIKMVTKHKKESYLLLGLATMTRSIFEARDLSADVYMEQLAKSENHAPIAKHIKTTDDKITFLLSLCSGDMRLETASEQDLLSAEIFRHMVLLAIDKIKKEQDVKKIDEIFYQFVDNCLVDNLQQKLDRYKRLPTATPNNSEVILNNGESVYLVDISPNKNPNKDKVYEVAHSIDVSKIIDKTSDFSNLIVHGDFICNKKKSNATITLPQYIYGNLDCSSCDTNLLKNVKNIPQGTKSIDFTHTITNFSDLSDVIFPDSVISLQLARYTINKILKNPVELESFQEFTKKYPAIKVYDDKGICLQDKIAQLSQPKIVEQEETKSKKAVQQQVVDDSVLFEKTDEWLSRKDIITILQQEDFFKSNNLDLDRLIRLATKTAKISSKTYNDIVCIHVSCFEQLKHTILEIIKENEQRSLSKQEENVSVVNAEQTKTQVQQEKPIVIEKYIPSSVWRDICKTCGDGKHTLLALLQDADCINIDPTITPDNQVYYFDKNNVKAKASSFKCETGSCFTQSPDTHAKLGRKRIVWSVVHEQDTVFMVALGFFEEHSGTGRISKQYGILINNAKKCLYQDATITLKSVKDMQTVRKLLAEQMASEKKSTNQQNTLKISEEEDKTTPESQSDANESVAEPVVQETQNKTVIPQAIPEQQETKDVANAPVAPVDEPVNEKQTKATEQVPEQTQAPVVVVPKRRRPRIGEHRVLVPADDQKAPQVNQQQNFLQKSEPATKGNSNMKKTEKQTAHKFTLSDVQLMEKYIQFVLDALTEKIASLDTQINEANNKVQTLMTRISSQSQQVVQASETSQTQADFENWNKLIQSRNQTLEQNKNIQEAQKNLLKQQNNSDVNLSESDLIVVKYCIDNFATDLDKQIQIAKAKVDTTMASTNVDDQVNAVNKLGDILLRKKSVDYIRNKIAQQNAK